MHIEYLGEYAFQVHCVRIGGSEQEREGGESSAVMNES